MCDEGNREWRTSKAVTAELLVKVEGHKPISFWECSTDTRNGYAGRAFRRAMCQGQHLSICASASDGTGILIRVTGRREYCGEEWPSCQQTAAVVQCVPQAAGKGEEDWRSGYLQRRSHSYMRKYVGWETCFYSWGILAFVSIRCMLVFFFSVSLAFGFVRGKSFVLGHAANNSDPATNVMCGRLCEQVYWFFCGFSTSWAVRGCGKLSS